MQVVILAAVARSRNAISTELSDSSTFVFQYVVKLTFDSFQPFGHDDDFVRIYDGTSTDHKLIAELLAGSSALKNTGLNNSTCTFISSRIGPELTRDFNATFQSTGKRPVSSMV
jgi:hypothetical protein